MYFERLPLEKNGILGMFLFIIYILISLTTDGDLPAFTGGLLFLLLLTTPLYR